MESLGADVRTIPSVAKTAAAYCPLGPLEKILNEESITLLSFLPHRQERKGASSH